MLRELLCKILSVCSALSTLPMSASATQRIGQQLQTRSGRRGTCVQLENLVYQWGTVSATSCLLQADLGLVLNLLDWQETQQRAWLVFSQIKLLHTTGHGFVVERTIFLAVHAKGSSSLVAASLLLCDCLTTPFLLSSYYYLPDLCQFHCMSYYF